MPRNQQLPHSVVTKIAAGEVIERPASVVKELLENAVDAGSTRIDVEVRHGGSDLIQVVDNGCGIQADALPLAFASHATSKLHRVEDLFHIDTLHICRMSFVEARCNSVCARDGWRRSICSSRKS